MAGKRTGKAAASPAETGRFQSDFIARIAPESHFHVALNHLDNTAAIVKDIEGRFIWVSDNLARRFGFSDPNAMIGLTDPAINPPRLVKKYRADDLAVTRSGRPLLGRVELVVGEHGMLSWNVTNKFPLRDARGKVIGLIATIQAYRGMNRPPSFGGELRPVVEYIQSHLGEPLSVARLAEIAGVSQRQIERRFRIATGMNPTAFVIRARLFEACRRLHETADSIGKIAGDLGFYDQCAFTRAFRRCLGATPGEFRQRGRSPAGDR